MPISNWIQLAAAAATVMLLLAAAFTDLARYRIPNVLVAAIVIIFAIGAAFNFAWPALAWSAAAAIGMFLLGAGLFAFGLFGGGDVKLIAAMALWTGVADLPRFLFVMSAAGGLLGAIWLVRRRLRNAPAGGQEPSALATAASIPNRIPYGVAIAVAGLDYFLASPHSPLMHIWPWAA
ncbi:MAG TPA: prepilin peptidase [Dongiaceae bacterium]